MLARVTLYFATVMLLLAAFIETPFPMAIAP